MNGLLEATDALIDAALARIAAERAYLDRGDAGGMFDAWAAYAAAEEALVAAEDVAAGVGSWPGEVAVAAARGW